MSYGMGSATGNLGQSSALQPGSYAKAGQKLSGGQKQGQMPNFTPEQMRLFQQLFAHVGPDSFTSQLASGDEGTFDQIEAPALKQFNALQGNIASRFSGMGGLGARKSSGFQNTLTSAASDFGQQLQSQRQGLQRQALMDLMNMSNSLLGQQPYENYLVQPKQKQGFFSKLFGGAAPVAGTLIGSALGGPAGAALGGRAGSAFGQAFM